YYSNVATDRPRSRPVGNRHAQIGTPIVGKPVWWCVRYRPAFFVGRDEMSKRKKTKDLFTTDQLEQWKDEVAEWWGAEKVRYDHKRTVQLFQQWFRCSKKEAIQWEFNSREEPEKFIERFLDNIIAEFGRKLLKKPVARLEGVTLSFQ